MADLIGGSLSEIEQLGATSRRVGEDTGEVFETVRARTDAFNADIEDMVQRLQGDVEEFTDTVESRASGLAADATATNWAGLSGDAKRERLDQARAQAVSFRGQATANVAEFRASLQNLVEGYYDHIAHEMGAVIASMQQASEAEATHAARFAAAARELDEAAARG